MTVRLSSLALVAALTTAAVAQTNTKPATTHHAATASAASTPPNVPKVPGIPKALYTLKYIDVKVGTGSLAEPSIIGHSAADSKIKWYTVRYTGWLTDGTKFDSSDDHPGKEPITIPIGLHRVIYGWDSGFEGMHIGGKRRLFIPYQLAYGDAGRPPHIPAKSNLIFDVELVSVSDNPPPPPAAPAQPGAVTPEKPATPATPATPTPAIQPHPQKP